MYSVVLLMALSGGAEAPEGLFHKNSCCGGSSCHGGYVVSSCCGGGGCHGGYVMSSCCGGSCHGSGHHHGGGLFSGMHHHKSSCCGGYSSCCGGWTSCCGGACTGAYWGCTGCSGGMIVVPPPPGKPGEKLDMPKPKDTKPKDEVSAPATIVLSLPADAKVAIDGVATASTTATRTFVTPELAPAKEFVYVLSAEIVRDGQKLTVSEQVTVRAGEETRVTFVAEKFTATTVAAK
jgi:uncharacterized protein (TIGR03000 family)